MSTSSHARRQNYQIFYISDFFCSSSRRLIKFPDNRSENNLLFTNLTGLAWFNCEPRSRSNLRSWVLASSVVCVAQVSDLHIPSSLNFQVNLYKFCPSDTFLELAHFTTCHVSQIRHMFSLVASLSVSSSVLFNPIWLRKCLEIQT